MHKRHVYKIIVSVIFFIITPWLLYKQKYKPYTQTPLLKIKPRFEINDKSGANLIYY